MKKLALLFFLFPFLFVAQESLQELATDYINVQEIFTTDIYKEKFFMHTNKTLYFSGEKIWYKIYVVYDVTNTPSYKTSNLHVNIYDDKKELIASKLVFVENGKVNGSLDLDPSYKTGTYYISLNTVYGSNFNSNYIKQIDVINLKEGQPNFNEKESRVEQIMPKDVVSDLNIEFLPESNVFLSRAYNTVYVKATLNGDPIQLEGSIVNVNFDAEVEKIKTNKEGLGAVTFPNFPDRKYVLKTIINGKQFIKSLPQAEERGFLLHYDYENTTSEEVFFKVSTNNETNKDYEDGEIIYAVIHRKGFLKSVTPIILESEYNNYALEIKKEGLFDGVNMLTVFNFKNEQIANRSFFFNKHKEILVNIEKGKETKDSVQLKINTLNRYVPINSSISVLTDETKMNANTSTIRLDFLLRPYAELNTASSKVLLNKSTSLKERDLLLQTSGRFKLDTSFRKSGEIYVKPENGLSITGSVSSKLKSLKGFRVLLTSKENNIVLFKNLKDEKTFAFNNLLLLHPSQYKLALLNPSGVIQEAIFNINPVVSRYKADRVLKFQDSKKKSIYFQKEQVYNSNVSIDNGIEQLGEVTLNGKTRKTRKAISLDSIGYVNNPNELGNGFSETIKKDPIQCVGCTIFEYMDQLPNVRSGVTYDKDGNPVYSVGFSSRGQNTFWGSNQALVILDGVPLANDLSTLLDLRVEDVESVKLNRSGAGFGSKGAVGVISIKLKKIKNYSSGSSKVLTTTSQTAFGFNLNTASFQYMPLQFSTTRAKMYFDTVDWIPNFTIAPNKTNLLNIAKEGNDNLKIIINGFNEEGDLLYQEVNINANTIN